MMSNNKKRAAKATSKHVNTTEKVLIEDGSKKSLLSACLMAGCAVGWNVAYGELGIGEYIISFSLCCLGYICYSLSLGEVASIISFPGGSFGYIRGTLGPLPGYIFGLFDIIQNAGYLIVFAQTFGSCIMTGFHIHERFLPLMWLLSYVLLMLPALPGGKVFWYSAYIFVSVTLFFMLSFCLGNAPQAHFNEYATKDIGAYAGSPRSFFYLLSAPIWNFIGIDSILPFSEELVQPKRDIPIVLMVSLAVTIIMSWWVTMTAVSIPADEYSSLATAETILPMVYGFKHIFGVSIEISSLLVGLTIYSSALAFVYATARQLDSMARSKLLPHFLTIATGPNRSPVVAIVTVNTIGMIASLMAYYGLPPTTTIFSDLCIFGVCMTYSGVMLAYLVFKLRFTNMQRQFESPLGVAGAIFALIYFQVTVHSMLWLDIHPEALIALAIMFVIGSLYYFLVVESRQCFSDEEQKHFFTIYVVNANIRRKQSKDRNPWKKLYYRFFCCDKEKQRVTDSDMSSHHSSEVSGVSRKAAAVRRCSFSMCFRQEENDTIVPNGTSVDLQSSVPSEVDKVEGLSQVDEENDLNDDIEDQRLPESTVE